MYKSTNDPWKSKRRDLWYLGYTRHLAKSTRLNQPNDCISADVTCTGLVGGGVYVRTYIHAGCNKGHDLSEHDPDQVL